MMITDHKMAGGKRVVVAVGAAIEPRWLAAIKAVDDRVEVLYEPQLQSASGLPVHGRMAGRSHVDRPHDIPVRTVPAEAEVVLGWPQDTAEGLAELVRTNTGLSWVQATVRGAAGFVSAAGLSVQELDRIRITGVEEIQAGPLAEFAMSALLAFAKGFAPVRPDFRRLSEQSPMAELAGETLLVLGLGPAGMEVARLGKTFGMRVLAVTRTGNGHAPHVDQMRPARFLGDMLPVSHAVVLALPLTGKTKALIGAGAVSRMRADAVLVNIGHGAVVDEQALVQGLNSGQPAAAVLDAFAAETLPPGSVLRSLPNVLISPHSAALSLRGNERLIAAFTANLRRYLDGDELVGLVRPSPHN